MSKANRSERYSNQVLFQGISQEGQKRIMRGSVSIVGCGALGSVSAMTLARAGVGNIRIIDRDFVEFRNLHRQILFDEKDAERFMPKAMAAQEHLRAINSDIHVEGIVCDLNDSNIEELLSGMSVIVDGTDNFETRFLLNEFSVKSGIPWIYGGCVGSYGLTFNIIPGEGPCLQCVFEGHLSPGIMETCDTAGVLPSVANIIASLQSTEALKILSGKTEELNKFLLKVDVWKGVFHAIIMEKEKNDCEVCERRNFKLLKGSGMTRTAVLCGRDSVQVYGSQCDVMNLSELRKKLEKIGRVVYNEYLLKFQVEGYNIIIFPDGRAIIEGTDDPSRAKSIYARYIGH